MKFNRLFLAAATGMLLMTSCGPEKGKSIGEMSGIDRTDSLMYYFGQNEAARYWRMSVNDTTMKDRAARDAYLKGVQAGLELVKSSGARSDAEIDLYNQGVFMGVQLAMNLNEFEKQYDLKPDKKILVQSLAYGLTNDTTVSETESQASFYNIMSRINGEKEESDKKNAAEALSAEVKKLGMKQLADGLYGKVLTHGNGGALEEGSRVKVNIDVRKADGEKLEIPMPEEVEIGNKYMSEPLKVALESMKRGGTSEFATTAYNIFGAQAQQMGLKANDVLILTIAVPSDPDNVVKPAGAVTDQPEAVVQK